MTLATNPRPNSTAFPWRHPHSQINHSGEVEFIDEVDVNLGIRHHNYNIVVGINDWQDSLAVKLQAKKLSTPGMFRITALKADGTAPTPTAAVLSGGSGAFDVQPGDTTLVVVDGGAVQTKTWAGTAGFKLGAAGTFAALDGTTLKFKVDGGVEQTVTFTAGAVDATVAAAEVDAQTTGCTAVAQGGQILITSSVIGTSSSINITGINAAAGFAATGLGTAGTGDAGNLQAITRAEAAAAFNAATTGVTFSGAGSVLTATSDTTGSSSSVMVDLGIGIEDFGFNSGTPEFGTGSSLIASFQVLESDPV